MEPVTRNRRGRHQQRPRCRAPRGGGPAGAVRAAGGTPGAGRARARLVVAGHRGAARRDQADRAPQVRPADREVMMFERFDADARTVVAQASRARPAAGAPLHGRRAPPARRRLGRRSRLARSCARRGSRRNWSRRRSSAGSGWARRAACSPGSTGTRWPPSASTWTRCGPGSRRRSGRRRCPAPPRRRTRAGPGSRARGRPGACAAGAAGAGPGGSWPARPAVPGRPADRPLLRSRAAAERAHPVHPGLEEDPRAHPAGGGRLDDSHIGVEHIALALTTVESGLVPPILSAAGTQAPALRTAILDRYRRAS